jgi:ArsR family transcriptional regulator
MQSLLLALRAVAEPTRLRLLAILARADLTVTELTRILGQSQPRISRHLKLMCDAGVLQRYQEGAWAFYRLAENEPGAETARAVLELVPPHATELKADLARLETIKQEHSAAAAEYFRARAAQWDLMRNLYARDTRVATALLSCIDDMAPGDLLDLGTGTGLVLTLLAHRIRRGLGIDASREMLSVARANLEAANLRHCQVRLGDIYRLSIQDDSMDVVTLHHVLHFLDEPLLALQEAARVLRPGGRLVLVDLAPHGVEELRTDHAHRRLGLGDHEVRQWCEQANLQAVTLTRLAGAARVAGMPLEVDLWSATRGAGTPPSPSA